MASVGSNLAALGTASYNGYTFSPAVMTTQFRGEPQLDRAGRTITHVDWTIALRDYAKVSAGSTIESTMEAIRVQLMTQGGAFVYANRGFGDLSVNTGETKWDVKWGPIPLSFEPKFKGRDLTTEFTWVVKVQVPESCLTPNFQFRLMAYNYSVEVEIDKQGYSTISTSGYIEIPMTRTAVNVRILPDHIDSYFDLVFPVIPDGFRRTTRRRSISEDKRTLNFTIVDEEMASDYPANVVDIDFRHSVSNQQGNIAKWTQVFRGSYTLDKFVSKTVALERFVAMCRDRIDHAIVQPETKGCVIPIFFSADESVHGREAGQFVLAVQVTLGLSDFITEGVVQSIVRVCGLWKPAPDASFAVWKGSLENTVLSNRGNASLLLSQADDVIVDLCLPDSRTLVSQPRDQDPGWSYPSLANMFPPPTLEGSWMDYENRVMVGGDANAVVMKTLPTADATIPFNPSTAGLSGGGDSGQLEQVAGGVINNEIIPQLGGQLVNAGLTDEVQYRTTPDYRIRMVGYAIRAGYTIPQPNLLQVGGVAVIPTGGKYEHFICGNYGVPVVCARWNLSYILPRGPNGAIPISPNPADWIGLFQ